LIFAIPTPTVISNYGLYLEQIKLIVNIGYYTRILGVDVYHESKRIHLGPRMRGGIGLGKKNYQRKMTRSISVKSGISIVLECEAKTRNDDSNIPRGISTEKTNIISVGSIFNKGRRQIIQPGGTRVS